MLQILILCFILYFPWYGMKEMKEEKFMMKKKVRKKISLLR